MPIRPSIRAAVAQRVRGDIRSVQEYVLMLQQISQEIMHTNYEDPHGRIFHKTVTIDQGDGVLIDAALTVRLPGWEEEQAVHDSWTETDEEQ